MKSPPFIILLVCLIIPLFGQNKFSSNLELSLSLSEITGTSYAFTKKDGMELSQNIFIKCGYRLEKNIDITFGLGYLVTRQVERQFLISFDDKDYSKIFQSLNYIVVPTGLNIHLGTYYLNPEIGVGYLIGHPSYLKKYELENDAYIITRHVLYSPDRYFHRLSLPISLIIGSEIDANSVKIILGIKGYYSVNSISEHINPAGHYYGVGIVTGVMF